MKRIVIVLAAIVVGCGGGRRDAVDFKPPSDVHEEPSKVVNWLDEPPVAPFRGKVAEPITWDLWGDWTIMRTERRDGKKTDKGRFDESWHPRKGKDSTRRDVWEDPQRGELFAIIRGGKGEGERIRWRRYRGRVFDFSVNRQSYGLLILADQDGENYLAIRQEGGN